MARWPNLFIAGAPRSGTSSLHCTCRTFPASTCPASRNRLVFAQHDRGRPSDGQADPGRDAVPATVRGRGRGAGPGEASPTYLEDPEAPGLIDRTVPGAKVIASLRDPVERLHSHYLTTLNNRPGMGSFMDEIKKGLTLQHDRSLAVLGPDVGIGYPQVRRFHEVFGDARFKVLIFEETMSDVPAALRGVLEVPPGDRTRSCEFRCARTAAIQRSTRPARKVPVRQSSGLAVRRSCLFRTGCASWCETRFS